MSEKIHPQGQPPRYGAHARISYLDNTELNGLRQRMVEFREKRTQPKNADFLNEAKQDILAMVNDLAATCPPQLRQLGKTDELLGVEMPTIGAHLVELGVLQDHMLADPKGASIAQQQEQCHGIIDKLIGAIDARRAAIQPKYPPIDPRNHNALAAVAQRVYVPYAKALAQAAAADRQTIHGKWMFHHLPEFDQLTRHTQCTMAMLDLASAVQKVADQCYGKRKNHFYDNRAVFAKQLNEAADAFNAAIPEDLRTNAAGKEYQRAVAAERDIREAKSLPKIQEAARVLKNNALEFVMGSHEDRKLFTRVGLAYKRSEKSVAREEAEHKKTERNGYSDIAPFQNPLGARCATMNLIYEARWALAADRVVQLLKDYKQTIANPTMAPDAVNAPNNVISGVQPKGLMQRPHVVQARS
jgi:hypothetical protein